MNDSVWRRYLDEARTPLWLLMDGQGRIEACNAALLHQLRRPREQVVGGLLEELLGPQEYARLSQSDGRAQLQLGGPVQAWFGERWDGLPGRVLLAEPLNRLRVESKLDFLLHHLQSVRTPLNTILGMAHLALLTRLTPQQRQYLQFIQNGGQSLVRIADALVDFGQGGSLLEFSLQTVLNRVMRHFEGRLTLTISPQVSPTLMGNPAALGDCLIELAEALVARPGTAGLELAVGLASAGQPPLLEFRFNAALPEWQSTGGALEELSGQVRFGPHHTALVVQFGGDTAGAAEYGEGCARRGGGGDDVLVVEDSPLNQQIVREILLSAGIAVEQARHGEEALQLLRQRGQRPPWRLILMDLEMPVMDGYETATRLRQDQRLDSVPIVAMSVHVQAEERERCLRCGMDAFLSKPIEPQSWLRTLGRWLPLKAPAAEPEERSEEAASPGWLDRRAGLERTAQNAELYGKLLQQFAERCQECASQLEDALRRESLGELRQQAHALRGVSANLGLLDIERSASQLERAAHSRHFEACRRILPTLLQALSSAREQLLLEARGPSSSPPPNPEEAASLFELLETQLAASLGDSLETLEHLQQCLGHPDWLRPLAQEVERFNFEGALELLRSQPRP